MASTNSDSVIWVVGEADGVTGEGVATDAPAAAFGGVFYATATTVPTAEPFGYTEHVTSAGDRYGWDGTQWVGPYTT